MSTVQPKPPADSNKIIQSFWTGPISDMERLCIKSYLDNGHEFHLYLYGAPQGVVPTGTTIKDANEVLPKEHMERFANPQQFSDHFRYTLLYRVGGWWMDMDTVCLRPFKFAQPYVFAVAPCSGTYLYNGFLKVPPNSPMMEYCMQQTHRVIDKTVLAELDFQHFGPTLVSQAVRDLRLYQYILPGDTFDPVHWDRAQQIVDPTVKWDLSKSYCVHLFHAMWNNGHESSHYAVSPNTDGTYPAGCLYERLKRRYIKPPKVSIVITTFNRPELLRPTLESFRAQVYKDYEVIVVDDGTDPYTKGICDELDAEYIKLRNTTGHRNPAYPNNVGIRRAAGDIIILQNAECKHVDPNTIEKLAKAVNDSNAVFARVMGLKKNGQDDWLYCGTESPRPFFFCGAIKKHWFTKLRGMDEDYPFGGFDDNDFADRLAREGVHFVFAPVLVHHQYHDRLEGMSADAAGRIYQEKTAAMKAGTLGTIRNIGRDWGGIGDLVVQPAPIVVPPVTRSIGGLRYTNNGLTLDWWDMHPR